MRDNGRILLVDDEEKNLRLLEAMLIPEGHSVITAANGEEALALAASEAPDAILLDVMMPGINGFEVCRRLKGNPETAPIPVIMVTSLAGREETLQGMDAGANDYLTKPVDAPEVKLRVRNALRLKGYYDEMVRNYRDLEFSESMRDSLTHMIIHDMRSPLAGLDGYLQLLEMGAPKYMPEKEQGFLKQARNSEMRMMDMVDSLLDINKMEEGKMKLQKEPGSMVQLCEEAVQNLGPLLSGHHVSLPGPGMAVEVACDRQIIRRVITNLLANAAKFTPDEGSISVTLEPASGELVVRVADSGPGIPAEFHEKVFEKFGQVEMRNQGPLRSTGLGLTFCKLAAEAHGGKIGLQSEEGKGSTFWFTIPKDGGTE